MIVIPAEHTRTKLLKLFIARECEFRDFDKVAAETGAENFNSHLISFVL